MRLFSGYRLHLLLPLGLASTTPLYAQTTPTTPISPPIPGMIIPVANTVAPGNPTAIPRKPAPFDRFKKYDQLPELTKQMVFTTQRGMEWLSRDGIHQANGRLIPGLNPALGKATEDDHFLRQTVGALALAKSAKLTGDEKFAVRAAQTILSLLSETAKDDKNPNLRVPTAPGVVSNRVGSAAYLCLAIYELPGASPELIGQAEELVAFIRSQIQEDGAFRFTDSTTANAELEAANLYAGPSVYAIALSNRTAPAAWKLDAMKRAAGVYRKQFQASPRMTFIPWMTAACVEAYMQSKEMIYADIAFEMNDWLRKLQYEQVDAARTTWRGGFPTVVDGKLAQTAPTAETAYFAMSLAECCRLIRNMDRPDTQRYDIYRMGCIRSLQFLTTLQYSEDNTQHFTPHFRPALTGAFHPSQTDGNIRTDQTAMCVNAFASFLLAGADE